MYHTHRKSETLLLSDFESHRKQELLEDRFFTYVCPRCGHLIVYLHLLSYVDKAHHFILLIKPKEDQTEADHMLYKEDTVSLKRYISDHRWIAEKIHILEDERDDRAIEILKVKLMKRYEQRGDHITAISYYDYESESQTLWFCIMRNESTEMIALMESTYQKICEELPPQTCTHYEEIQQAWAMNYISRKE